MIRTKLFLAAAAALAFSAFPQQTTVLPDDTSAHAAVPTARLGDAAAPLKVQEWIKGAPVDLAALKGKKPVVVEFWATWCPPCRESIPHLTDLQKKYGDKVQFVGITDEEPPAVKAFVDKLGAKMDYTIGIDADDKTGEAYMGAFGVSGIPQAFVVSKDGAIVFMGHPQDPRFEKTLDKLVDGTFNLKDSLKEEEEISKIKDYFRTYLNLAQSGQDNKEADKIGQSLYKAIESRPEVLGAIAWEITMTPELKYRDLDLALKMSKKAVELSDSKDADLLDTHARVLFTKGNVEEAITLQKKALEMAKDNDDKQTRTMQLKEFQDAQKAKQERK